MDKNTLYTKAEEMKEMMGESELLDALMMAMSSNELQENLEFIDRMYDTNVF